MLLLLVVLFSPLIRMGDYWLFGESLWSGIGFHFNMDALGLGCLLQLFHSRLHQNSYYQRFLTSKFVYVLPLLILSGNLFTDRPRIFAVSTSMMNISIALCIDWVVTNYETLPGRLLNSAPMVYLGTMSYSIYLWQQLFFDKSDLIWTKFPLNFIGLAVMSLISYYFIEKSAHFFRQRLEPKIFEQNPKLKPTTI